MKTIFCTFMELEEVKNNKDILLYKLGEDFFYYIENIKTITGLHVKALYFLGISFAEMSLLSGLTKEAFRRRIYNHENYDKENIFKHKTARYDLTMFVIERTFEFGYNREEIKSIYSISERTLKQYLRDINRERKSYDELHNINRRVLK